MSEIKIGILTPWWADGYGYEIAVQVADAAEELGYDVLWFADHVAVPTNVEHLQATWFEVLTLMSNIAARTRRIALGTNVLVVPYRQPVLAAKMLATLDVVSGGRLIIGAGSGFLEPEFRTLGIDHFKDRGAYTDECIRVWKAVWSGDVEFATEPRPVQRPHPPIWIGNTGERVLKRVAALGDGWHPVGITLDRLRGDTERLHAFWTEAGRAGQPVISYGGWRARVGHDTPTAEPRTLLSGSAEQVADDLRALAQVGCGSVVFRLGTEHGESLENFLEQLELIATRVLPAVR